MSHVNLLLTNIYFTATLTATVHLPYFPAPPSSNVAMLSRLSLAAPRLLTPSLTRALPYSTTRLTLAVQTIPCPSMGDSITEGTVIEWSIPVGGAVAEGDVVALIETDKVTVDLKAELSGVLTAQLCEVDDTIEVGKALYMIDSEGTATVTAEAPPAKAAAPEPAAAKAPVAAAVVAPAPAATGGRVPSLKFLGKSGWAARKAGLVESVHQVLVSLDLPSPDYDPLWGRPAFSEAEMDSIETGGAMEAPDVKVFSGGAKFSW